MAKRVRNLAGKNRSAFKWHHMELAIFGLVGWALYLGIFVVFFPKDYNPDESRVPFYIWMVVSLLVLSSSPSTAQRFFQTRPEWRGTGIIAVIILPLILNSIVLTYFENLFTDASPHADVAYGSIMFVAYALGILLVLAKSAKDHAEEDQQDE